MVLFIKNLLFTILVPGTVAVYVPVFLFDHGPASFSGVAIFAVFALLAGGSVYAWCLWDFATAGRGTPAPIDPPRQLVVRGLYRYSRNPMYVGVLSTIAGWALLFRSRSIGGYLLGVAVVFHLVVLLYEEPQLERTFGQAYQRYRSQVGRWLPLPWKATRKVNEHG